MSARRNPPPRDSLALTTRVILAAPLGLVCVVLSLLSARPELAVLGAGPLLLALLSFGRPLPEVPLTAVDISARRVLEGDRVDIVVRLEGSQTTGGLRATGVVDVQLALPSKGMDISAVRIGGVNMTGVTRTGVHDLTLRMGTEPQELTVTVTCRRWGTYIVGVRSVAVADGAFRVERGEPDVCPLVVLPSPHRLQAMITTHRTQQVTGRHPSPGRGAGLEFADIRRFQSGDRPRDINWRASTRHDGVWVNDRHPDRSADVILLLDSVEDTGGVAVSTLDAAVRAAASVAEVVLRLRDRVGFVGIGGRVRWLRPDDGLRQWYRLAETLVGERPAVSHPGLGLRLVPRAVLPPDALVVALTPLLDERVIDSVVELGARGTDVLVIEIDPADLVAIPPGLEWHLARRVWNLDRAALRRRLAGSGITVVRWSAGEPFAEAIAEAVRARRRLGRHRIVRPVRL